MLITKIELENIKSYQHVTVEFRPGTTAISGSNGAGKTTLVEAVGFALFDYLPYKQEQFVREGEKQGKIVIQLIGNDDRPYVVERRCGSGSRWTIFDSEANLRLEQRADVRDKLQELFGIDRERPLDSLFRDALGVPQGTFTSIFLEAASKRKQTFDALLQIEDYKTAADYLLDAQKQYKEQLQEQHLKIKQLEFGTSELETLRLQFREMRRLDEEQKHYNLQWTQQLEQSQVREKQLTYQSNQLQTLRHSYENGKLKYENAERLLSSAEQQLQAALTAQAIVQSNQPAYQHYQQAEEHLQRLRKDEQQRSFLLNQESKLKEQSARTHSQIDNLQERLAEVAVARQRVVELAPLVLQQMDLERQREELLQRVERYNRLSAEEKQLGQRLANYQQQRGKLEGRISAIEPLVPIAERLSELTQQLTELQIQRNERKNKLQQLETKREELQRKQLERTQYAEKLRKAEHTIQVTEEHRAEADEFAGLQTQLGQIHTQKDRLEGNIEAYTNSLAQSAGGQCPLLHESCLNIKKHGIVSLEFYFENLLTEERARLAELIQQEEQLSKRSAAIKKFADALSKLEQLSERRDAANDLLQRATQDGERLERDIAALSEQLDGLQQVEQQLKTLEVAHNESKRADLQVRELPGLFKQVQQLQEQQQQGEADLQELRQHLESLRDSAQQLAQVNTERAALRDPASQTRAQQEIIEREAMYQHQLQGEQQRAATFQQQAQTLQEQLAVYRLLDAQVAEQEERRKVNYGGYQSYLQNQKEAQLLPERLRAQELQVASKEEALEALQQAERAYQEAEAVFDPAELEQVRAAVQRLENDLATLAQQMKHNQEQSNLLTEKIERAEALLVELEEAQKEQRTLEDLQTMMEQFRKLIKEAAPAVLKARLGDISAEANRIFGEIMGDRTAALSWQNDYEIMLRRQGVNRTFAQLSGGEQMSAALSVRLALLKKLSTLNIAFFDEPTQNMDELRRMNLAEQIRRVRGFDQLIVISHDDTFEQGLDSLIRLNKVNGETCLQQEDGARQDGDWRLAPVAAHSTIDDAF